MNPFTNTALDLTVQTDYTHDGPVQEAQNQIEKSALYLYSIFNLLKTSAVNLESSEHSDEINAFLGDTQMMSELGLSVVGSIQKSMFVLVREARDYSEMSIAEQIAFLIKSDEVPSEISDALAQAVSDLQSDSMNQREQTPEYINLILETHKSKNE